MALANLIDPHTVESMLTNMKKAAISTAVLLAASLPSHAAFVFNLQEVGPDVVLSGSGTLNLAGLSFLGSAFARPALSSTSGIAFVGGSPSPGSPSSFDVYGFVNSTPGSFGTGLFTFSNSASGDAFGFRFRADAGELWAPSGYTSGSLLAGTATFAGQTLSSLGATIGTYTWTWGSGATADSMTLNVGSSITPVPEPSAYALALTGLGVLGFWGRRQKAQKRTAEVAAA